MLQDKISLAGTTYLGAKMPSLRKNPTTYEELRARVDEDGGVYYTTAQVLRDIKNAGRLGQNVRASIVKDLADRGMAALPEGLPQYQEEPVIIYANSGVVARVVEAVMRPSAGGAHVLRGLADSNAQETLQKIRELVGVGTQSNGGAD